MSPQRDSITQLFLEGKYLLQIIDLISFFISNIVVFYLINRFIEVTIIKFLLIFLFNLVLIKLDIIIFFIRSINKILLLTISSLKRRKWKFIIDLVDYLKIIVLSFVKLPFYMYNRFYMSKLIFILILLFRIIFLNSIQYLLFTLIIWMFSVALFIKYGYIPLNEAVPANFYNIIGLVGILAGFFQYYIQRYEDKIQTKLSLKMNKLVSISDREVSFDNFKDFMNKSKNFTKLKKKFKIITEEDEKTKREFRLAQFKWAKMPGKEINIYPLLMPPSRQDEFKLLEDEIAGDKDSINLMAELLEVYKIFFSLKRDEILKIINKENVANELIEMLFLNINFLTEVKSDIIGVKKEDIENLKSANEFIDNMKVEIFDDLISNRVIKKSQEQSNLLEFNQFC